MKTKISKQSKRQHHEIQILTYAIDSISIVDKRVIVCLISTYQMHTTDRSFYTSTKIVHLLI